MTAIVNILWVGTGLVQGRVHDWVEVGCHWLCDEAKLLEVNSELFASQQRKEFIHG